MRNINPHNTYATVLEPETDTTTTLNKEELGLFLDHIQESTNDDFAEFLRDLIIEGDAAIDTEFGYTIIYMF